MNNLQFQVLRNQFVKNRLVETPLTSLEDGEVLVKVEKFSYTANNITYAVAGDIIGYWQFFPPLGNDGNGWGVIPVWGFAEVVESKAEGIIVGERLFGYFPPAHYLKVQPIMVAKERFIDGSAHRAQLPSVYNLYRRLNQESNYHPEFDNERMLLFPLHLTAFSIWDFLKDNDWFGAKQIVITSASSKTSTGLGYALQADETAPTIVGITSERNLKVVESLNLYNQCYTYDALTSIDANLPTVIVDMAGNAQVMANLHTRLGDHMRFTSKVGITHWADTQSQEGIIKERSKMFFAPSQIQKRIKEWGAESFDQKSAAFLKKAAAQTKKWLVFTEIDGLKGLAEIHPTVCGGTLSPQQGLIVVI